MEEARALQGQGYFCERRNNQTEGQEDSVIWSGLYFTLAFSWNRVWAISVHVYSSKSLSCFPNWYLSHVLLGALSVQDLTKI